MRTGAAKLPIPHPNLMELLNNETDDADVHWHMHYRLKRNHPLFTNFMLRKNRRSPSNARIKISVYNVVHSGDLQ